MMFLIIVSITTLLYAVIVFNTGEDKNQYELQSVLMKQTITIAIAVLLVAVFLIRSRRRPMYVGCRYLFFQILFRYRAMTVLNVVCSEFFA